MLHRARCCYTASRLSVCPSVSDVEVSWSHVGCNSSKISSRLVSVGYSPISLSAHPNITRRGTPEILTGIGEGYGKSGFRRTKAQIALKYGKIGPMLLLRTSRKSYTHFRIGAKINDLVWPWRVIIHPVSKHVRHGVIYFTFSLFFVDKWLPVLLFF